MCFFIPLFRNGGKFDVKNQVTGEQKGTEKNDEVVKKKSEVPD